MAKISHGIARVVVSFPETCPTEVVAYTRETWGENKINARKLILESNAIFFLFFVLALFQPLPPALFT